jgi:hypothetical protein
VCIRHYRSRFESQNRSSHLEREWDAFLPSWRQDSYPATHANQGSKTDMSCHWGQGDCPGQSIRSISMQDTRRTSTSRPDSPLQGSSYRGFERSMTPFKQRYFSCENQVLTCARVGSQAHRFIIFQGSRNSTLISYRFPKFGPSKSMTRVFEQN